MLLIPTYIAPSGIAGTGLYAAAHIAEDTHIWMHVEGFDLTFAKTAISEFPLQVLDFLQIYGHYDDAYPDCVCLCGDHGRFMNHSENANTYDAPNGTYTSRAIARDEEITANYLEFGQYDAAWRLII